MLARLSNWSRRGALRSRLKRQLLETPFAISVASADDAWLASSFALHVSDTVAAIAGPGGKSSEACVLGQAVLAARLTQLMAAGLSLKPRLCSILADEAARVCAEDLPPASLALLDEVLRQAAGCDTADRARKASAILLERVPGVRRSGSEAWESLIFLHLELVEIADRVLRNPQAAPATAPSSAPR